MARKKGSVRGSGGSTSGIPTTPRGGSYTPPASSNPFKDNPLAGGILPNPDSSLGFSGMMFNNDFTKNQQNQLGGSGIHYDSPFSALLARFAGNSDVSQILNLLAMVGQGNVGEDWNKQLTETLINYILKQEQRNYDAAWRDEQRLYDNPQNALARLMGAGISRDAAIQMLNSGAGSGGAMSQGDSVSMSEGIAPSQTRLNDIQGKTAIANSVFNGINTVANLMSLGFSAPQSIAQATALGIGNAMNQKMLTAINSADAVTSFIGNAVQTGALTQEQVDQCSTSDDALNLIGSMGDSSAQFMKSPEYASVYGTQMGREQFNRSWKNFRNSRDEGVLLDEYLKQQKLQTIRGALENSKIGSEMELMDAQKLLATQEAQESMARIVLIGAQVGNLEQQNRLIDEQIYSLAVATEGQEITNGNLRLDYELNASGFPMLKEVYVQELTDKVTYWSTIMDPKVRQQRITTWLNDEDNRNHASYLEWCRLHAVGDFREKYYGLYMLSAGFNACGGSQALTSISGAAKTSGELLPKAVDLLKKMPK